MQKHTNKFITNSQYSKVITEIISQFDECEEFIISVAFITLSGVICILESLRQLKLKGVKGKILTGCYLNFTEPKAIEKLLEFDNIELKILDSENFHAKGFFFRKADNWHIMIGSANLTQSALTVNSEWNLLFSANCQDNVVRQILAEFNKLFDRAKEALAILDDYRLNYEVVNRLITFGNLEKVKSISPNFIQSQALENLKSLRLSNIDKALIISATGTGKTFLSAFDVALVKPKRCLFVVHRTNIATKAKDTFAKIIKDKKLGLYTGSSKSQADYLFATIQTLKDPKVFSSFQADEFDYIIIDEVHHAEANSYKKILGYFKPKFLLGMTATPERTDTGDIFKLFDYNIAYEIRLHQALEQDLLCPFHYFAIEDFYLESEKVLAKDFAKLTSDFRINHIVGKMNFYGFSGQHRSALMFVSNVNEAKELATKLNQRGIKSQALTSQDSEYTRDLAISKLESYSLEVIVTVDIFNEGIDIPCINQVILLRPTQSSIVYIQQLGRGLRKFKDKKFVVVLDFIANYENNFLIPVALSQDNSYDKDQLKKFVVSPNNYISGKSTITFTNIAKELIYRNIQKTNFSQLKNIKRDYVQLKKELGKIPTLVDLETHNFIAPEVILSAKDTYYDILKAFKEDIPNLNEQEYRILKFISKEFTPAKRLYEILILEKLLKQSCMEVKNLERLVAQEIENFNIESFVSALQHLSLKIFTVNAGRQEYTPLIKLEDKQISLLPYSTIIGNSFLQWHIQDLLVYNKLIYQQKYHKNKLRGLSLYAKYSKKDIAHLLNQDYTNGGVNLAGYRFFDNKALLFMTFDENKKFSQYDNKFLSDSVFTFYSKKNKSLEDKQEKALAKNSVISYVFARVEKNDGYYYLGDILKCIEAKELYSSKTIRYTFELSKKLPADLWVYFKTVYKNQNSIGRLF
ncbi:DNA repair helicase Rad25 [Francisella sp. W12-1067]|nr:DNA repair helicase Rad25 [Francisella sp. W12-1067]